MLSCYRLTSREPFNHEFSYLDYSRFERITETSLVFMLTSYWMIQKGYPCQNVIFSIPSGPPVCPPKSNRLRHFKQQGCHRFGPYPTPSHGDAFFERPNKYNEKIAIELP